jgi:predicted Zn-dependent protease
MAPRSSRGASARLAAGLLAGVLACAINPVTGEREIVLMSQAQEAAQGRQAAEQVVAQIGLVDDPQLNGYVRALGERLARHSPRRDVAYQFAVADMASPTPSPCRAATSTSRGGSWPSPTRRTSWPT